MADLRGFFNFHDMWMHQEVKPEIHILWHMWPNFIVVAVSTIHSYDFGWGEPYIMRTSWFFGGDEWTRSLWCEWSGRRIIYRVSRPFAPQIIRTTDPWFIRLPKKYFSPPFCNNQEKKIFFYKICYHSRFVIIRKKIYIKKINLFKFTTIVSCVIVKWMRNA